MPVVIYTIQSIHTVPWKATYVYVRMIIICHTCPPCYRASILHKCPLLWDYFTMLAYYIVLFAICTPTTLSACNQHYLACLPHYPPCLQQYPSCLLHYYPYAYTSLPFMPITLCLRNHPAHTYCLVHCAYLDCLLHYSAYVLYIKPRMLCAVPCILYIPMDSCIRLPT